MIYFFDDRKLAEELRDNVTPEFEKFAYFVLLVIWQFVSSSSSYIAWSFHPLTHAERLLDFYVFVVSMTGVWTCYDRNKEGDHRDFITRFTCLSFPASVRMIFLGLLIALPLKFLSNIFQFGLDDSILMVVVNLIMSPYFYYRLYKTIGICASLKPVA